MPTFTQRLLNASETAQSLLCIGLDIDPKQMPVADPNEFNRAIVSSTADLACAYKPNLAFYEALGIPGMHILEATLTHIRDTAPHCIIIGDCKRGDIDVSANAYATAMFDVWGFDAVTVNPWGRNGHRRAVAQVPGTGRFRLVSGLQPRRRRLAGSADQRHG